MRSVFGRLSVTVAVVSVLVSVAVTISGPLAHAEGLASYTAEQAKRGAEQYGANCAACHGPDLLGGAGAPALAGPEFGFSWRGKPVKELYDFIKGAMPPGQAGALTDAGYADIVAHILKANGAPEGEELRADRAEPAAKKIP